MSKDAFDEKQLAQKLLEGAEKISVSDIAKKYDDTFSGLEFEYGFADNVFKLTKKHDNGFLIFKDVESGVELSLPNGVMLTFKARF